MDKTIQIGTANTLRRALLICGILAIPLYAVTDILASILYPSYNFIDQAVSELFAIGAPTSSLVVPLFTVYSLLLAAFATGVWKVDSQNRALRFVGLMIAASAVNGLVLWNFFPMNMRGVEMAFTDTMHVILAATGGIFAILAVGVGVFAFGKRFRFYSIASIAMLIAPMILGFSYVPQVATNEPSPWLGLLERISFAGYMQWQIVLAIVLLRRQMK